MHLPEKKHSRNLSDLSDLVSMSIRIMYTSWCIMHVHKLYNISNKSIHIPNKLGSSEKIQYIPIKQNQPPWKKKSIQLLSRPGWAEIQYFEESSPLICVDRTPHDPPGYSLGETISAWPGKERLI